MSKKNNNEVKVEQEVVTADKLEEVVTEEPEKKGFGAKAVAGIKKHGKKIVAGVTLATVGIIGYALGHKSKNEGSDYELDDLDDYELEDHSSEEI